MNIKIFFRFIVASVFICSPIFANAEYERSCGYSIDSLEAYMPLKVEVTTTIIGNPSGNIRNKKRRLAAKQNAGQSALNCINDWVDTNFNRFAKGKLTGNTTIPFRCENPTWIFNENYGIMRDIYFTNNTKNLSFSFSKLSKSMENVCNGGSGRYEIVYGITKFSGDGECPNGSGKVYELTCKKGTPISVEPK